VTVGSVALLAGLALSVATPRRATAADADDPDRVARADDARSLPVPVEHAIEIPVTADVARGEAVAIAAANPDPGTTSDDEASDDDALELELDDRQTSFPDPFESVNRHTLSLNQTVDRWVVAPVADAYGYVMPDRAKRSVRDFLANLESPAILVNDVLQGEMGNAAVTVARFSVNTVIGLAGLFDPASAMGLERHEADFGQTLARNGFASGPFLIVPLLGPTTVRDGVGTIVDIALQPTIYLLGPTPLVVASVQEGTVGLTMRERHGEDLRRLEQASLDYYAALRSAYYQDRMAQLGEAGPPASVPVDVVEPVETPMPAAVASAAPTGPPT
jgi:phospholipid-binding lipoprotein MlaA